MKRLMFTLALLATIAVGFGAGALEVKAVHKGIANFDGSRAAGEGIWVMTFPTTDTNALPNGVILWTGDGSDYWMQYKVGPGGTSAALEFANPQRIPSYMLLPLPAAYDSTASDGTKYWIKGMFVTAPTDSFFYRWTYR